MDKSDLIPEASAEAPETQCESRESLKSGKKKFVIPEISVPVDVLEATTFFQVVDSGGANP